MMSLRLIFPATVHPPPLLRVPHNYQLKSLIERTRVARDFSTDIVIYDPNLPQTITNETRLSKCGWSPYHGREMSGSIAQTILRGKDIFAGGTVTGKPGYGKQARPTL